MDVVALALSGKINEFQPTANKSGARPDGDDGSGEVCDGKFENFLNQFGEQFGTQF